MLLIDESVGLAFAALTGGRTLQTVLEGLRAQFAGARDRVNVVLGGYAGRTGIFVGAGQTVQVEQGAQSTKSAVQVVGSRIRTLLACGASSFLLPAFYTALVEYLAGNASPSVGKVVLVCA